MTTRTARGTASSKANGATLTIPSFTVPRFHSLVVCAGYDNAQGAPDTVTHAGRHMTRKVQRDDATNGIHASIWMKGEYNGVQTGPAVLTWAASIGKKAAVASSFDRVITEDSSSGALQGTTTSPGSGATATLTKADDFAIGCFVAEGPSTEHASATADIQDNGVWESATLGQKDGTVGAPPISNITVIETFRDLTSTTATRARLVGADERNWIALVEVARSRSERYKLAISPTDFDRVDEIVTAAGGDPDDVYFGINADGIIEAYETTTPGTLRATYDPETGFWNNVGSP